MTVRQFSTSHLRHHPALRTVWSLADDSPDFHQIVASIERLGILDPLKVTEAGLVADGRHRLRAAKRLELETVPCIVIDDDAVQEIALATLADRRHLVTKGQLAYAGYPLFAAAHAAALARHADALRSGNPSQPHAVVEEFAERLGIGRDLFFQAAKIHALFAGDPELRTEWEPRIMCSTEPVGLGAVIAGIAGRKATEKQKRAPQRNSALSRWCVSWKQAAKSAASWDRWSTEEQDHAADALRSSINSLPDPLLDVVRDALRATRRSRKGGDESEESGPLGTTKAEWEEYVAAKRAKFAAQS